MIALILGGANTLAEDRAGAEALIGQRDYQIIACNHAARDQPGRIDHWASMHPELFPLWTRQRAAAGLDAVGRYWHPRHRACPIEATAIKSWGGSSGLFCVNVAMALGCRRIILAGVPLIKTAKHYDDSRFWNEARGYWPAWELHKPEMEGIVRSMSGWTRKLLGAPDERWIDGAD